MYLHQSLRVWTFSARLIRTNERTKRNDPHVDLNALVISPIVGIYAISRTSKSIMITELHTGKFSYVQPSSITSVGIQWL